MFKMHGATIKMSKIAFVVTFLFRNYHTVGSGGMVNSLGDDSIAPCETKRHIFMCLLFCMFIVVGLFESPDLTPLDFCFWGWLNSEVCERKAEARRIARSHFGCCCPNKET